MSKPRQLPYVFVDIEAEGGGNVVAVHANCTLHTPEAPSRCPWARYYTEPPHAGEPCAWYDGGDCHCGEILREGMRRIRDYIGATLEEDSNG